MFRTNRWISLILTALFICCLAACGEDEAGENGNASANNGNASANNGNASANNGNSSNGSEPECGDPERDGHSECAQTASTCGPGQYCNVEELTCSVGCLSNSDCAGDQFCDLDGGPPGTCLNCSEYNSSSTTENNTEASNQGENQNNNQTVTENQNSNEQASCEDVCDNVIAICPDFTEADRADCEYGCGMNITQAERECVVDAPTCPDAENCFPEPMNFDDGGGSGTSNEGENQNQGEVDDFGEVCHWDDDCQGNKCYFEDPMDSTGYCTAPCNHWDECPIDTSWDCQEISGASGKFCVQD